MKGQSAIEFLSIVALGLVIITITSFLGTNFVVDFSSDIAGVNAKQTTSNILSAATLVYSQGIGAQTKIGVTMPPNVVRSGTFLDKEQISIRYFTRDETDVFGDFNAEIKGSLPTREGNADLLVRMEPNGVAVLLDDPGTAMIFVETYSDAGYTTQGDSFIRKDCIAGKDIVTVYYSVLTFNLTGQQPINNTDFDITWYNPGGEVHTNKTITISGGLGSYTDSLDLGCLAALGNYLLSVMDTSTRAVGTAIITLI